MASKSRDGTLQRACRIHFGKPAIVGEFICQSGSTVFPEVWFSRKCVGRAGSAKIDVAVASCDSHRGGFIWSSCVCRFFWLAFPLLCLLSILERPLRSGELDPTQRQWIERYRKQANAPEPANMLLNHDPEPSLVEGFVDLVSPDDLSDWIVRGGHCKFEVQGQVITATCVDGSPSTYLCTKRNDYSNFVLTAELRYLVDGNTGIQFRSSVRQDQQRQEVFGPQVELEEFSRRRGWSGGIYGQSCGGYFYPLWCKEHREVRSAMNREGWNRLTLQCDDQSVKTWINGQPAAHWQTEGQFPIGFIAIQSHAGPRGTVQFRNLRLKER